MLCRAPPPEYAAELCCVLESYSTLKTEPDRNESTFLHISLAQRLLPEVATQVATNKNSAFLNVYQELTISRWLNCHQWVLVLSNGVISWLN